MFMKTHDMKRTKSERRFCADGRYHMIPRKRTREESIEVFWSKVNKSGEDDCWFWTGLKKDNGNGLIYGLFWDDGNDIKAHRFSFLIHNSEIPKGLLVCHKCDQPLCVNPKHLFLGSYKDNNADTCRKRRNAFGEKSPGAILTEHSVREIRLLYVPKIFGFRKLAEKYGVSESCIQGIIEGRTWKHLL